MKKILSAVICLLLLANLSACGGANTEIEFIAEEIRLNRSDENAENRNKDIQDADWSDWTAGFLSEPYNVGPFEFDSVYDYYDYYTGQYDGLSKYLDIINVPDYLLDHILSRADSEYQLVLWKHTYDLEWKDYYDRNISLFDGMDSEYYLWNAETEIIRIKSASDDHAYIDNRDVLSKPLYDCTGFDLSTVIDRVRREGDWEVRALDIHGTLHTLGNIRIIPGEHSEQRFDFEPISIIAIDIVPPDYHTFAEWIFIPVIKNINFASAAQGAAGDYEVLTDSDKCDGEECNCPPGEPDDTGEPEDSNGNDPDNPIDNDDEDEPEDDGDIIDGGGDSITAGFSSIGGIDAIGGVIGEYGDNNNANGAVI